MQKEIIIAGFGGQGVLFAGQVIAYAAMDTGKEVTWIPSYGPEMRGGTANCTVIIADGEIGSPVVQSPSAMMILNDASFKKFENKIARDGLLILNTSLVPQRSTRFDIRTVEVRANEIAERLGDIRIANMVMLGAYLKKTGVATIESVLSALKSVLPERRHSLIPLNEKALASGGECCS